ncbi:hypothetical protein [Neptunomonas japonica]|uniref:hypothetical protein n=1 Tax=Neptunomonas japonica TaxID=417574 RepID=UPI000404E6EE|nr:hypothetical protein [Neptunomonas japonica]
MKTIIFALCCISTFTLEVRGSEVTRLSSELATLFFGGSHDFVEMDPGTGWKGVVIVPPGTSIAQVSSAYDGLPDNFIQKAINNSIFDKPIMIENGYGKLGSRSMESLWEDILEKTRPAPPLPRDRRESWKVYKWLFQPIIRGGKVVGYTREPSKYVKRYQISQELFHILINGKSSGLWNLHSNLKKYKDYDSAIYGVLSDWQKSGFKSEVDSALWSFEATAGGARWKEWSIARAHFDAHRVPIEQHINLPETYIIPPPSAWGTMGSWIKTRAQIGNEQQRISYQVATVKLHRPWMDIERLVSGRLKFKPKEKLVLSDGTTPSSGVLPSGRFSSFATELILVRDISLPDGLTSVPGHPLGIYATPKEINLIGYIVRVLPKIPTLNISSKITEVEHNNK